MGWQVRSKSNQNLSWLPCFKNILVKSKEHELNLLTCMVLFCRYSTSSCFLFFGVSSCISGSRGGALQATPLLSCLGEHCVNWDQVTPGPAGGELGGHSAISHASQTTPRPALRTGRGLIYPLVAIINHWETQHCASLTAHRNSSCSSNPTPSGARHTQTGWRGLIHL